jgi:hypothetical protein
LESIFGGLKTGFFLGLAVLVLKYRVSVRYSFL